MTNQNDSGQIDVTKPFNDQVSTSSPSVRSTLIGLGIVVVLIILITIFVMMSRATT